MDTEGLYSKLGVDPRASTEEIKRAYKKLALECHPDKVHGLHDKDIAVERFKAISHAYEILVDPQSRARYDIPERTNFFDINDPLASFFMRPPIVVCNLDCSLEELFTGTTKSITINTDGKLENLTLAIQAGTPDNTQHLLKGKGQLFQRGNVRGDLVLTVKCLPHQRFERCGDDLFYKHEISLKQALLGWKSVIKGLDGKEVLIGDNAITNHGKCLTFHGSGMPNIATGWHGDLIVTIDVKFPVVLTASQRTALACCDGLDC